MTLGSLFAGIGGFELAATWAGIEPIWSNEIDSFCCNVLRKNFEHEIIEKDIREIGRRNLKRVDIISGGFPCQPFSQAGKRKGKSDDRYLWPEMLRVIKELQPPYVIGENVAGLLSMENGETLKNILIDLENEGYNNEIFSISACSVSAWHRRERIWIISNTNSSGHIHREFEKQSAERGDKSQYKSITSDKYEDVSNTDCTGLSKSTLTRKQVIQSQAGTSERSKSGRTITKGWKYWTTEPKLDRVAHGVSSKLDKSEQINYETIEKELLAMWHENNPTRLEKWKKRFNIQEQEILHFAMLWILDREQIQCKEDEWEENCTTKIQINKMRKLWLRQIITEASYRQQSEQQYKKQYSDFMSNMPQGSSSKKWDVGCIWNEEPDIPRVETGIGNRVNRLKALGNAIVPQVAYELFKAIKTNQ